MIPELPDDIWSKIIDELDGPYEDMSTLKWKCWNDIFFAHVVGRGRGPSADSFARVH